MNKQRRDLFYYLGRNEKHDYPATPLSNMIVAGHAGAGMGTFIDSMLLKLIQECNPNELKISILDCNGSSYNFWRDNIPEGRKLLHLESIETPSDAEACNVKIMEYLKQAKELVDKRKSGELENNCSKVILIEEYKCIAEMRIDVRLEFNELLGYLLENSEEQGIYIIFASISYASMLDSHYIAKFTTRVGTPLRCNDELSNVMLGNNCAAMEEVTHGIVWVKYGNRFPERLYVPFYPNTLLKKHIRTHSVRNNSNEIEVVFEDEGCNAETIGEYGDVDKCQTIQFKYCNGVSDVHILYNAIPSCQHEIKAQMSGGIKCTKCGGWYCA